MTQTEYLELIEKHPDLTVEGFGVNMKYAGKRSEVEYIALKRDELKDHFHEFQLSLEWLEKNPILEGKFDAHYWKDKAQFAYKPAHPGYFHIPRGVFTLVALQKGYRVRKMENCTDAWIEGQRHD